MTGLDSAFREETRFYEPRKALILSVGFPLLCAALIAMTNAYISPDSWDYIEIAQSLRHGAGCSKAGKYFAMFPCGYPVAIATLAFSNSLAGLVVASKLANLGIALACLSLLAATVNNRLVVAFLMLNPVMLVFMLYSWSENLMFLAICGILFSVDRISHNEATLGHLLLLALFLILGCMSRYFFGTFAVVVFLAIFSAFGWKTARRCFPAFLADALFFAAYLSFNWLRSGHATGIPRPPAPESFLLLGWQFLTSGGGVLSALLTSLAFLCAAMGARPSRPSPSSGDQAFRQSVFLLGAGLGYLMLQLALRTHIYYDGFGWRTLGHGIVLTLAGVAGMILRPSPVALKPARVLLLGLLSLAAVNQLVWQQLGNSGPGLDWFSWRERLANYRAPPIDAEAVVSLSVPKIAPAMSGLPHLWYGETRSVISVKAAPFDKPDTPEELIKALRQQPGRCVIDFSGFASPEALKTALSGTYPVSAGFSTSASHWTPTVIDQYDPRTRHYLQKIFSPNGYVPCEHLTSALAADGF